MFGSKDGVTLTELTAYVVSVYHVSPSLLWEMGVYFSTPPPHPSKIAVLTTYCLLLTVNLLLLDSENKGFYEPINESHLRPE